MSSETIDLIDLLKEYLLESLQGDKATKKAYIKDGFLCFENFENSTIQLPLDSPTAWKIQKNSAETLTVGAIWFLVINKELKAGEYMR